MRTTSVAILVAALLMAPHWVHAQARPTSFAPVAPEHAVAPENYVIGTEDVLSVVVWREQEMSGDVTVRPDGMITLPLVGDIRAAGLTTVALKKSIEESAARLITDPNVTIAVRQLNSRKVFITGEVQNPGTYPLTGPRTLMQLIALAGGLLEYADSNNIVTLRTVNGKQVSYKFRYKDVAQGKSLEQNIELQPGDTVIVP
jgi:polysaccharide biosynthesis/export protein